MTFRPDDSIPSFDPMQLVHEYQSTIIKLTKVETEVDRKQLETAAQFLRVTWKNLKGHDTIHEMAFGDTLEE